MRTITISILLILVSSITLGTPAFAEPLTNVKTSVLNYDDNSATVKIIWNHDNKATKYKVGCVSCNPNSSEFTTSDSMTLYNVTPIPNGSSAMLYVISYDSQNKIISAKQLIVNLNQ